MAFMTVEIKVPVKFKDIILKSTLLHPGPPPRYQLKPKKECLDGETENDSKLRRWTFGERDPSKPNKTILVVGETGTGKSTLINAMVNYVMGVEWEDKVWFEIVEEERRSQSESQTSEVTVYEIFGFEGKRVPYSLTVIDSPGYGDTRGTDADTVVAEKLQALFRSEEGIHEIDAVGFVVKATENRLSDRQKYIFDAVVSLFGKDLERNIVALVTHSDGGPPINALQALEAANIKCAKDENNQPIHFLFNNRQSDNVTNKREERVAKFAWETTSDGLEGLSEFLTGITAQKLNMTVNVLNNRDQLNACICNLQERIAGIEKKQEAIHKTKGALENHKAEMAANQNFTYTESQSFRERVSTPGHWYHRMATTCTVCEENCHYPGCTVTPTPFRCIIMRKGHCIACHGRCHHTKHVRQSQIYITKTRQVTRTYEELKRKYDMHERGANEQGDMLARLEEELQKLDEEKIKWVEECYQCVVQLEDIALNADSLSTHVHLDVLIKQLKERQGNEEKVQRLEEIKIRAGAGQGEGMSYFRTKLGKMWPRK